ncbi:MAG TPA: iron chelate uptake ABC transporter family permease subunit, partial [Methylomirabilota bacterium]|nr:iron chelate uptake ABC transporter family permease subunit [Methylomirabilota bacterium]
LGQIAGLEGSFVATLGLSAVAFAGALLAATTVYLIASVGGRLPIQTLLLAGVITGLFFSAAITLTISLLDFTRLGGILHWLMGSLGVLGYRPVVVMALGVVGAGGLLYGQARALNLLALGEEAALQLGVEAERVKRLVFVAASLLTGVVVAHAGPIGFVGLIVPHGVRIAVGSDNRLLLPVAAGAGATFLVLADTLARVLVRPAELPVGVVTAFCGAPFFVYLLRTRLRRGLA